MLVNTAVLILAIAFGVGKLFPVIPDISNLSNSEILMLPLRLIPAVLALTSLQFLLFELTDSLISGILLQFFVTIALAYASGCFYPISFFPTAVQSFSKFTPSGLARAYLSSVLSGADGLWYSVALVVYAAILLIATIAIRRKRIKN